jgi:hypothetical protein
MAQDSATSWERLGRAAERFAREVARDARDFATRIEEHAGTLAGSVASEWRAAGGKPPTGKDVRQLLDDVRGVVTAVVDGVDQFISETFADATASPWKRATAKRAATCARCSRAIPAGSEEYVRRAGGKTEHRCPDCGASEGSAAS